MFNYMPLDGNIIYQFDFVICLACIKWPINRARTHTHTHVARVHYFAYHVKEFVQHRSWITVSIYVSFLFCWSFEVFSPSYWLHFFQPLSQSIWEQSKSYGKFPVEKFTIYYMFCRRFGTGFFFYINVKLQTEHFKAIWIVTELWKYLFLPSYKNSGGKQNSQRPFETFIFELFDKCMFCTMCQKTYSENDTNIYLSRFIHWQFPCRMKQKCYVKRE